MKKLIVIIALLAISGCSGIPIVDDPIIKQTGIDGETASWLEAIFDWIIMLWPARGF